MKRWLIVYVCGMRVVGCLSDGVKGGRCEVYTASQPAKPYPSDAPRPLGRTPNLLSDAFFCTIHYTLLCDLVETDVFPVALIKHGSQVRTRRWHASGTSRGGLRSGTLVNTQHIASSITEYLHHFCVVPIHDASCCDDFISFTSSSPSACRRLVLYRVRGLRDRFLTRRTDVGFC
jgi:hypothetical protein